MAQSELEVAQAACYKVGTAKLTALGGTSKASVVCTERGPIARKALLRWHPWNFALARARSSPTFTSIDDVVDNGSGAIEIQTSSTTGLSNGDRVTIDQVEGSNAANGTWYIESVVANTSFDLTDSTFTGTPTAATGRWTKAAKFDYAYSIAAPSDALRIFRIQDYQSTPDWRYEGGNILTDEFPIQIHYIADVTDYTLMDVTFYECLSLYLAWDICQHLSSDTNLRKSLWEEFRSYLAKARFFDATEDPAVKLEANEWTESRFISPFVTNPIGSI